MTKSEIISFVKSVRIEHDTRIAAAYVAKEDGKGLSTNDFTTTAKNKLDSIEAGAQVNLLNAVSVTGGGAASFDSDTKVTTIDLSSFATTSDITAVTRIKGSKDYFSELPTSGNVNGDVWNIKYASDATDRYGTAIKAGDNVVYIEDTVTPANSGWDILGGTTDLSNYVTIESGKGLSANDFTTAYKDALDSLVTGSEDTFSNEDVAEIFTDPTVSGGDSEPATTGGGEG